MKEIDITAGLGNKVDKLSRSVEELARASSQAEKDDNIDEWVKTTEKLEATQDKLKDQLEKLNKSHSGFETLSENIQKSIEKDEELKKILRYESELVKDFSIKDTVDRKAAQRELIKKTEIFDTFLNNIQTKGTALSAEQKTLYESMVGELKDIGNTGFDSLTTNKLMTSYLENNKTLLNDIIQHTSSSSSEALKMTNALEELTTLSKREEREREEALKRAAMDKAKSRNEVKEGGENSILDTILKPFKWVFSIAKIALPILAGFFALDKVFGKGEALKALTDFFDNIKPALMEIGKSIYDLIKGLVPVIQSLLKTMLPVVSKLIAGFSKLLSKVIPILLSFVEKLADLAAVVLPPVIDFITEIVFPAIEFFFSALKVFVDKFFEFPRIMNIITKIVATKLIAISKVVTSLIKSSSGVMNFFASISTFFGELIGILKNVPFLGKGVSKIGNILSSIGSTIAKFGSIFGKILKFLGWPLQVVMSIFDFINGFKNTEGDILDKIIGGIKSVIKGILYLPLDLIDLVASFFGFEEFTKGLRESVDKVIDFVMDVITWPARQLFNLFTWIKDNFVEIFSDLWANIKSFISFAWDIITWPHRKLWEFFQWLGAKLADAFKALWDGMQSAVTFVWDIITWPYRKLTEIFSEIGSSLSQTFGQAWDKVKEIGTKALDIFMTPINLVKDLFSFIGDTFSGIYESAKAKVAGMWEKVKSFPSRILSGFIGWLIEWLDDSWIPGSGKLANWLRDKAKDWGIDLSGSEAVDPGDQLKASSDFSRGDQTGPELEPKDLSPQLLSSYKSSADASFGHLLTEEERKKLSAVQSLAEIEQLKRKAEERHAAELLAAQKATASSVQAAANQMQQTTQIVISSQQNNTNYNNAPTSPSDAGVMAGTSLSPAY